MTWLGDRPKLPEAKQLKLKAEREKLVLEVQELQKTTVFKTDASKRFHLEDLTELARKIGSIDKKLGRV